VLAREFLRTAHRPRRRVAAREFVQQRLPICVVGHRVAHATRLFVESALTHVASYRRELGASAERVWENVHDWEHLPYLHASSFRSIALEESAPWGWRARIGLHAGSDIVLELRIDADAPRYVSRTLAGPGAGSEIWTNVNAHDPGLTIVEVEFWLPGVAAENAAAVGAIYQKLYERLWDEDESMMLRRTRELARPRVAATGRVALGPAAALRARLPHCVEWEGRPWRIVELDGELVVHATICPHALGPLEGAAVEAGAAITCPWHGWRFDVRTGTALDGRRAQLPAPPRIESDAAGDLWLVERR
jgi:nitrite reductase/ring-hydroxylating ferredoxin subunit